MFNHARSTLTSVSIVISQLKKVDTASLVVPYSTGGNLR